jgi:hypothetical protein
MSGALAPNSKADVDPLGEHSFAGRPSLYAMRGEDDGPVKDVRSIEQWSGAMRIGLEPI